MATSVHDGRRIAWWQEPTRDQWHAWIAAWLRSTLNSFDFTIFVFIMLPISREFDRSADSRHCGLYSDVMVAIARGHRFGLARGPHRTQDAADDLYRLVLRLQLHRRLLSHLRLPVLLPRIARYRHGRGVAGRRISGDGDLADPLALIIEQG